MNSLHQRLCSALLLAATWLAAPPLAADDEVTVPANVGVGPAVYAITGPVFDDQPLHYGLRISVAAIIDSEWIAENRNRIPEKYRGYADNIEEARISPSIFIPDSLIISPKVQNTGIYGVTWRPLSLTLPIAREPVGIRLGAGAVLTYAYVHSDSLEAESMHFFRPGIDAGLDIEIPFSERVLLGIGWTSRLHIPQVIGGEFLEITPIDESMWHFGTAYVMLHYRFPYTVDL